MSSSDLYLLNKKSTTHVATFRNGYGSAPRCWDHLGSKYIEEKPVYSLEESYLRKVWDLASDDRVALHEKVPLMMTFDRAYVPIKMLEKAGNYCIRFGQECENGQSVNHWAEIGEKLIEASRVKHSHYARGIVLSPTSVSDCWSYPSSDWLENAWSIFEAN